MTLPSAPVIRVDWFGLGNFAGPHDNISAYVDGDDGLLTWTRGRSADGSEEATGSAVFLLDNSGGRFTPDRNWCDNPSFETGTAGWAIAATAVTAAATSISQVTDNAPSAGAKAGSAVLTATQYSGVSYPIPYRFRAGVAYAVTVYLKSTSGNLNVRAGLASVGTPLDIATSSGNITTSWAQYTFSWTPQYDRTDVVFFVRTITAATATVRIDAVQINAGATANAYIEAPTKGQLTPGKAVHIYNTWSDTNYPAFHGYVWRITPDMGGKTVTVTCYDQLRRMAETDASFAVQPGEWVTSRDLRAALLSEFERGVLNCFPSVGFEYGMDGWWCSGAATAAVVAETGAPGGTDLVAEVTFTAGYQHFLGSGQMQPRYVSGETYTLSLWVRSTGPSMLLHVGLGLADADHTTEMGSHFNEKTITATTTWQRVTVSWTLDLSVTASQLPAFGAPGNIIAWVRNESTAGVVRVAGTFLVRGGVAWDMTAAEYAARPKRWPNYCRNGSFDGGSRTGWAEAAVNVVSNGTFETTVSPWFGAGVGSTMWWGWFSWPWVEYGINTGFPVSDPTSFVQSTAQKRGGSYSLLVTRNYSLPLRSGVAAFLTVPWWDYHSQIAFSGWIYSTADDHAGYGICAGPSADVMAHATWVESFGNWHHYAGTIGGGQWGGTWLIVVAWGASDFYLDDVTAFHFTSESYLPAEIGASTGPGDIATPSAVAVSTAQAKYGTHSLAVTSGGTVNAGVLYDFRHSGAFFCADHDYSPSLWLYAADAMPYKALFGYLNAARARVESSVTGTLAAATWTKISLPTQTPSVNVRNGSETGLGFYSYLGVCQTDTVNRTFYVDGVRVTPAPADVTEPPQWDLDSEGDGAVAEPIIRASSVLAALSSLSVASLTRHWVAPSMTAPYWVYTTEDRTSFASRTIEELYDDDFADLTGIEVDSDGLVNSQKLVGESDTYVSDQGSIDAYGLRPGPTIDGGMYYSDATALSVGQAIIRRKAYPRSRPRLVVRNRFPSQMEREVGDLVSVNCSRQGMATALFTVLSFTTRVGMGGNLWETTYQLEEYPYDAPRLVGVPGALRGSSAGAATVQGIINTPSVGKPLIGASAGAATAAGMLVVSSTGSADKFSVPFIEALGASGSSALAGVSNGIASAVGVVKSAKSLIGATAGVATATGVLVPSFAYETTCLADSPTFLLPMDEASGNLIDIVASKTAVPSGSPAYGVAGPMTGRTAIDISASTQFFTVTDHADLDLGDGPFSVEMWLARDVDTGSYEWALSKQTGAYAFGIQNSDYLSYRKPGTGMLGYGGEVLADSVWHHYVWTRSASRTAGSNKLYIDGTLQTLAYDDYTTTVGDNASSLLIGVGTTEWFNGKMAYLGLYKSELSQARVSAHYAARS